MHLNTSSFYLNKNKVNCIETIILFLINKYKYMRKFSQLNEGKIEVETNSINYLSVNELKKYIDKQQNDFYSSVTFTISEKNIKTYNPKEATLTIIQYLIKHNDSYINELAGTNKGNALSIFFRKTAPSDPEKLKLYRAIAVLNTTMRLKEVPTFMTRKEFDNVMSGKCSLDYVVYDMETEKGRNAIAKQYKGLVLNMANKYKNHANLDWGEWVGAAHIGLTTAMNQYSEFKGIITKNNKFNDTTVKYDDDLKQEVKNNIKKADKYPVKFVVFAKWCINFQLLDVQKTSHLVHVPVSAQRSERATTGKNTRNNTVSIDKKTIDNDIDPTVPSTGGFNNVHSIAGKILTKNMADDNINKEETKQLFTEFYNYLKKHLDKLSIVILLTHFGLNGLEKIGNKDLSEYITNSKDEDINKLYDAVFSGDSTAEKQWIKDYGAGKFKKRADKVKGAGKPSLSMKLTNVINWIRHDKNASNALKQLYYF